MIIVPPIPFRGRRGRIEADAQTPAALALVAATYFPWNPGAPMLRLTFNQTVEVPGLTGSAIVVRDGQFRGELLNAVASSQTLPDTVDLTLTTVDPWTSADVRLTAGEGTGIVAVDDGEEWDGVADLALPFIP